DPAKSDELAERIRFLNFRIELRLHPHEPKHDSLIALLQQAPAPPLNSQLNADIKAATYEILREEWKRAAKGR
ncbi:MAG TPA: hypothetical protein VED00_01810, partial [archaeon]|nr:hypothetical protein [archaeon]